MSFYLDTNILVALLTPEPLSGRAQDFMRNNLERLIVSDFAAAEFVSAIARRVRTRETTIEDASNVINGDGLFCVNCQANC